MMPTLFHVPILGYPIRGYGFMLMLGFLSAIYIAARRARKSKADPDVILNVGFIALIGGVVGSRLFYVIHYWKSSFAHHPNPILAALDIRSGGLEFYGGFILVTFLTVAYLVRTKLSLRLYTDIMAPSLMWGLAFGRVGCFLNGCCWGAVCATPTGDPALPWAVRFPYGSAAYVNQWFKREVTTPAELLYITPIGEAHPLNREHVNMSPEEIYAPREALEAAQEKYEQAKADNADEQTLQRLEQAVEKRKKDWQRQRGRLADLDAVTGIFSGRTHLPREYTPSEIRDLTTRVENRSMPVHPSQLYSVINALLLSLVLSAMLARRKRHGIVLPWLFILYSMSRATLEMVRVDNPLDTAGLTISQAISVCTILLAVVWLITLYRMPLRSKYAVPFIPPEDTKAKPAKA